jgi:uncharacterized protein
MRIASSLITSIILSFATISTLGCASSGDEYSETDDEAAGAGKLSFWQATDGQWHFNLKSGNGAILLTSEAYSGRTGAINGALSVLDNGVDPAMYEVNKTSSGYNVRLKAANSEIIAFTQVYASKSSATRAVTSCVKAVTSYLDKREALSAGARVEVGAGETGKFHFNFFARNGEKVLSSESYTTDAAAFNGAFAVQTEGQSAAAYTLKQNTAGGFYFTVKALNGQVIGVSQQYSTKSGAEGGMASLQKLLPTISVL